MKSLKEKWERSVQSAREKGGNEVGASCIITALNMSIENTTRACQGKAIVRVETFLSG